MDNHLIEIERKLNNLQQEVATLRALAQPSPEPSHGGLAATEAANERMHRALDKIGALAERLRDPEVQAAVLELGLTHEQHMNVVGGAIQTYIADASRPK